MTSESRDIVVVGGGFAGATLAHRLERLLPRGRPVVLLNRDNHITYTPLLPEVAGASILPGHVVAPLRQMVRRAEVRSVEVTEIDLERRAVRYAGPGPGMIPYDQLVLACGIAPNLGIAEGMDRHALPLVTLGDALTLRNRVLERLEAASIEPDAARSRWLTSYIVIGGGFSGVEVAGALIDFLASALRYYPLLHEHGARVVLVHNEGRLLPELPAPLGERALARMGRMGLEVHLNATVTGVDADGLTLADGGRLAGGTLITTAGTAPTALIRSLPLEKTRGRIKTAPDMSVPGHDGLWAIGDCAAVPNARDGALCPPTAQFATRQAAQLARNIQRRLQGRATRPFSYRALGQLASIGHNKGVGAVLGLRLGGLPAWLLWRGVYLLKMPTLGRKLGLLLAWSWGALSPPDVAQLRFRRSLERADGDKREPPG